MPIGYPALPSRGPTPLGISPREQTQTTETHAKGHLSNGEAVEQRNETISPEEMDALRELGVFFEQDTKETVEKFLKKNITETTDTPETIETDTQSEDEKALQEARDLLSPPLDENKRHYIDLPQSRPRAQTTGPVPNPNDGSLERLRSQTSAPRRQSQDPGGPNFRRPAQYIDLPQSAPPAKMTGPPPQPPTEEAQSRPRAQTTGPVPNPNDGSLERLRSQTSAPKLQNQDPGGPNFRRPAQYIDLPQSAPPAKMTGPPPQPPKEEAQSRPRAQTTGPVPNPNVETAPPPAQQEPTQTPRKNSEATPQYKRADNTPDYNEDKMTEDLVKNYEKWSTEALIKEARDNSKLPANNPLFKAIKKAIEDRLAIEETKKSKRKSTLFGHARLLAKNVAENRFGHGTERKQLRAVQKELDNVFHKETENIEKAFNSIDNTQKASFFKIFKGISGGLKEKGLPGGEVIDLSSQGDFFDIKKFLTNVRNPKACGVNDNFSAPKESFIHTPTLIAFRNAITQSLEESKVAGQELSGFDALLREVDSLIELANKTQSKQLKTSYSSRLQDELSSIDPEKLKSVSLDGTSTMTEWQVKEPKEHNKQQDLVAGHAELRGVFQGHVQGKSVLKEDQFSGDGAQLFQRGNVYASAVVDAAGNTENSAKATAKVLKIIEQEMDHLPTPPTPDKLQEFFMNIIQQGHIACKDLDRECTLSFNLYLPMENGKKMLVGFSLGDTFNVLRRADGTTEVLTPDPEGKEETANGGGLGNITRFGRDREFDVYVRELEPGDEVGQMSDFGRDNHGYIQDRLEAGDSLMDAALNVREPPKNEELETRLATIKERLHELNGQGDEYRALLKEYNSLSRELQHPIHPRTKKPHKIDDSAVVIFKNPT